MLIWFFLFIFGLCIGSFINAFEYRIENEKAISGRSFCPNCKHKLSWYDLVPVFSWVSLLGKCRYCKKSISIQYPIIELLAGFTFVSFGVVSGLVPQLNAFIVRGSTVPQDFSIIIPLFLLLFVAFSLILIALHDYKTGYVLSNFVYFAIFASILYHITAKNITNLDTVFPYLLSAALPAAFFFALYKISNEKWMGEGDYEIALLMGIFLGWLNILVALYIAFIVGSIVGLVQIYIFKTQTKSGTIPFAPFLVGGTLVAFVFGQQIFQFYVRIFLGG